MGITDDARARIVFFDLSFMPLVEEIAPRLAAATIRRADRLHEHAGAGHHRDLLCYEDVIAGAADDFDWPDFDEGTIASLCRGRSGGRAGPRLFGAAADGGGLAARRAEPRSQEVVLSAVPMSHSEGWGLVRAAWEAGAGLVFPGPGWTAARFTR